MSNFNTLTDLTKLNKKPNRIRIKEVQRSGSVADVLGYCGNPEFQKKNLALLNNIDLADKLARGDLIKITSE